MTKTNKIDVIMDGRIDYRAILRQVQASERYQLNLDLGEPRPGHPEGTIRAHIEELELNLEALRPKLTEEETDQLRLLIHTHDTFKPETREGLPIADPRSHASLARAFLAQFLPPADSDERVRDLLTMVQNHDVPFALWRQAYSRRNGQHDRRRLDRLVNDVRDWRLFGAFLLIDGQTAGKSRLPLDWLRDQLRGRVELAFTPDDLPARP